MSNGNTIKLSPKLRELCKWHKIDEVNAMLDRGDTPVSVSKFINTNGFKISNPLVYEYAKLRKRIIVEHINVERLIGASESENSAKVERSSNFNSAKNKLKSELDVLDTIISMGWETLQDRQDQPMSVGTMLQAIKMKNDLTEGAHAFLTNYGMEQLKEVERNKYDLIIDLLMSYIPEEEHEDVKARIEQVEDEYYQTTDFYEEYLKAKGLTDEEVYKRLQELEAEAEKQSDYEDENATISV